MNDVGHLDAKGPLSTANPRESARAAAQASVAWNKLMITLVPVFGRGVVAAIYRRTVECAEIDDPWLSEVRKQTRGAGHVAPLLECLSYCTPNLAAATQAFLLEQFTRQRTLLIGDSLAQPVLEPACATGKGETTLAAPTPDEISEQFTLTALGADANARPVNRCESLQTHQ